MSLKRNIIALGAGIAIGYFTKQAYDQYKNTTPEKALENAKETFRRIGPISGSWIYMKPEQVEKNGLLYDAYRGGITRNIDGEKKQYEFFADVETGAVINAAAESSV